MIEVQMKFSEQDNENLSFIEVQNAALELLAAGDWKPDNAATLLQAFKAIDTENLGYIEVETMQSLLRSQGSFFENEMKSFLNVAKDPQSNRIYYENYIALMSKYR
jgi:Ca2+-binding EF-hand superfamily protein